MTAKKKRVYRKPKPKPPKGYDSVFEHELHKGMLKDWEFHPSKISYSIPHKYEPDFKRVEDGKTTYIEVKGRFRTSAEAAKYLWIRETFNSAEELVFIFYKGDTPMPNAKRRKDGTKNTHSSWAKKNNFRYYCMKEGFDEQSI